MIVPRRWRKRKRNEARRDETRMRYTRGTRQAVCLAVKIDKIDRVGRRDTAETGSFARQKNNIASRSFNDLSLVKVASCDC